MLVLITTRHMPSSAANAKDTMPSTLYAVRLTLTPNTPSILATRKQKQEHGGLCPKKKYTGLGIFSKISNK